MLERSDLLKKIIRRRRFGVATDPLSGYLAFASFTQADSTTSLGTAEKGGVWTNQQGTAGTIGNRAYFPSNVSTNVATLTLSAAAGEVGADFATTDIAHPMALCLRLAASSTYLKVTFTSGIVQLLAISGGSPTTRISVPQASSTLPGSGAAAFTASATIDPVTNSVQLYVNAGAIGTPYTLSAGEITSFAASLKSGLSVSSAIPGPTNSTAKNFYAK